MLASALAVLLGLGSFVFYMAAFVYPEVHRRLDLLWSGLGLLYAGVLWFDAEQMTGLVLLGQMLAVVLLLGLGWQTLTVRRQKTPVYQQTPIVLTPEVLGGWAKSKLNELRIAPDESVRSVRLERRVSEDPALLSARLDPRRRPAYDYEFVEDGVVEVQQGELFADFSGQAFSVAETAEEGEAEATALAYTAPPSAEAEVVTVETPTPLENIDETSEVDEEPEETAAEEDAEEIDAEDDLTEAQAYQSKALETVEDGETAELPMKPVSERKASELSEIADAGDREIAADSDLTETELTDNETARSDEMDTAESEVALNDSAQLKGSDSNITEETDWFDDLSAKNSDPRARPAVREKPSLLAMPLILVGWVKDVVVSITKPKPSKPMIEIPRRDPVVVNRPLKDDNDAMGAAADRRADPMTDSAAAENAVIGDSRYNDKSEDDDWEDSNWAD